MRLIDADKLIEVLNKKSVPFNANVNDAILTAPTVDAVKRIEYEKMRDLAEQYKFEYECIFEAHKEVLNEVLPNRVEVVRCKDCKEYKYCYLLPNDDDYCSKGERKEDDER